MRTSKQRFHWFLIKFDATCTHMYETCVGGEIFYENRSVGCNGHAIGATVELPATVRATVNIALLPLDASRNCGIINQRILEEGLHSDVVLVAKNGAQINCNKCFLAVHSTELCEMLTANTSRFEMYDMSEAAVRAFLAYLYTGDTKMPNENPDFALALLKAGRKYKISDLESVMKDMFRRKEVAWLDPKTALCLFVFVRELGGYEEVTQKAVDVLKVKFNQRLESTVCSEIIQENLADAANAANAASQLVAAINSQSR